MPYLPSEEEAKIFEPFKGHQPSNIEMNRWPEEKFLSLGEFIKYFTKEDKKGWNVNRKSLDMLLGRFKEGTEDVYWREFLVRMDTEIPITFISRLKAASRVLGFFLRRNPAFITQKVKESFTGWNNLEWGLETFSEEKTKSGTKIVVQNDDAGITGFGKKTPEVLYQSAIHHALNIFNLLMENISIHDIKKLTTKEKIDSIGKFAFVLNTAKNNKTKSQVFIGLNVGKENRQSLEEKLADYQEEQERISNN